MRRWGLAAYMLFITFNLMENQKNELAVKNRPLKLMIKDEEVQKKFREMLGENAPSFLMSVLNCASNNDKLAVAEPQSIIMASAVAATLRLPVDPNLGMSYIIPYYDSKTKKTVAQFQIGYKGLIALCHRTNQFTRINVEEVYEGEIENIDRLTGDIKFNWNQDTDGRKKTKLIGVVAYFRLTNGFEKTYFMSDAQLEAHGKKYSQTYKKGFGLWKDDNLGMKRKTVLKLLIEKFAPKTVEMQKALITDQSIIKDAETLDVDYIDNDVVQIQSQYDQEQQRITDFINGSIELAQLDQFDNIELSQDNFDLLKTKKEELLKA